MAVLIDGNNLLFAAGDQEPERPPGRAALCAVLARWAQRSGQKVHVVFDGPAPDPAAARQIAPPPVEVSFSGNASADEHLARLLEAGAGSHLLVVSSDRQVVRAARRRGAATMASDEFWRRVRRELRGPSRPRGQPPDKSAGPQAGCVDDWLREFGIDP